MTKIANLILPIEQEDGYFKTLKPADRFTYSRIVKKPQINSRKRLHGLSQKTLLPQISQLWQEMSSEDQSYWNEAATYSKMQGFRLFVQDTAYRLSHDIAGIAVPNNYHQANVGKIIINSPATEVALLQVHPNSYYVLRKVRGTKSQYEPVKITEDFGIPLTISLNYKSDLTAIGDNPVCAIFAEVISSFQGVDRIQAAQIDLDLSTDWKTATAILTETLGHFLAYTVKIYLFDVQGTLLFDNVEITHNAVNWARDPKCNKIETTFTKRILPNPETFAQITLPTGSDYASIYPED